MTNPQTQTGFVVSDLHLFTERSSAHRYMDRIHDTLADADFLVLNGDIVDFRWTTLPSKEATAHAADDWLADLCIEYPHCQFYYVMGNHDGWPVDNTIPGIFEDMLRNVSSHWGETSCYHAFD